ncbi:hypothetical protein R3P38DRAFT_2882397 [Favolaschia claudopus]|uniref:Uncharacterized protein n=1 Tax=Favolaschia claudopus TaxID=2862362 RepID=A0AAW0D2D0_9AGAR
MTEVDYSPEAYHRYQRTQQRISNWADDTAHCAPQYKNPFLPRTDVQNNFYHKPSSRSSSSSRSSPTQSHSSHHGRRTPQRTQSYGYGVQPQAGVRSPLRSHTIAVDAVSPEDSISQVSGPSHRSGGHRRAHSHSPSRHTSSHHHRSSHRSPTTAYVVPQYGGMPYVQAPQQIQYAQPQPAAYVVDTRSGKVQPVYPSYPPAAHPSQEHHGGFLSRLFGSQSSGKHSRSRSLSGARSGKSRR